MDSTQRFSNRVDNYVKTRPGYPAVILDYLQEETGFGPDWTVADIGSGTGISTALFLDNGNTVYGVEPNRAMRESAEELLHSYDRFISVEGTAEHTGLETASIDMVVASQAFHWFDPVAAKKEFRRILRNNGPVALIWNERQIDTPFEQAYESLLLQYAIDYTTVNHKNISEEKIAAFFGADGQGDIRLAADPQPFRLRIAANEQVFDRGKFKGRILSSSYMPDEQHPAYPEMIRSAEEIFEQHQEGEKVKVNYLTKLFVGRLSI